MKVFYSASPEGDATIWVDEEIAKALGSNLIRVAPSPKLPPNAPIHNNPSMAVVYDAEDRMFYICPGNGPSLIVSPSGGDFYRMMPRGRALPPSGKIEVQCTMSGDLLSFVLPEELPPPRVHVRRTVQDVINEFVRGLEEFPDVKLKVMAPGYGMVPFRAETIKITTATLFADLEFK